MTARSSSNPLASSYTTTNEKGNTMKNCERHGEYKPNTATLLGKEFNLGCPKCHDERIEAERQREENFERERIQEMANRKIKHSRIPKRFINKTFDNYETSTIEQAQALSACSDYADDFESNLNTGRSLILFGDVGTGKTHLATAIANQVIRNTSHDALYCSLYGIMLGMKATFDASSDKSEMQFVLEHCNPELLIIDEVGATKTTEFELATLFAIINKRYENQLPTIIVTNLDIRELSKAVGERSLDRLRECGGKAVSFNWGSMRSNIGGK